MQQHNDSEGLQVDTHAEQAAKAPEVAGYNQNGHYYAPPGYQGPAQQQRLPFGLGVWTFAVVVALVTAVIVGGGVGGGLGGALSSCKSDYDTCTAQSASAASAAPVETIAPTECPTAETNDTSSAENDTAPYVPRAAASVDLLELNCPDDFRDARTFKSNKGYEFKWYCGVNAPAGSDSEEGGKVADLAPIIAYTIQDCLNACSAMIEKFDNEGTGVECKSVVFSKKMSEELSNWGANCWLKNATKAQGGEWGFKDDWYAYAERDD
ncbi:hypothetical protein ACJ41O_012006 [Fusarium nematophilum]